MTKGARLQNTKPLAAICHISVCEKADVIMTHLHRAIRHYSPETQLRNTYSLPSCTFCHDEVKFMIMNRSDSKFPSRFWNKIRPKYTDQR